MMLSHSQMLSFENFTITDKTNEFIGFTNLSLKKESIALICPTINFPIKCLDIIHLVRTQKFPKN